MRYGLRTLVILTAIGPPAIAWAFSDPDALVVACGWTALVGFFVLWYWMLDKSQSLDPTRRIPLNDEDPSRPNEETI